MKMSGVKMLGLAGALVTGSVLLPSVTCDMLNFDSVNKNKQRLRDANVSAKALDSLERAANKNSNLNWNPLDAMLGNYTTNFQAGTDSILWTKKLDSAVAAAKQLGKQAAIDSLEKAGKLVK